MKNILFLNTTKLAVVLKRTLLVLVLCITSVLCIQAEESTIEPSDSIAVTGPKKSHWLTGFNFIVDTRKWHNKHDFAQVKAVVKVYNEDGTAITDSATIASTGKVSLEVTDNDAEKKVEDGSPVDNGTSSAYINWHCNTEVSDNKYYTNEALVAAHKLKVKLTAALVEGNTDYVFAGWSTNQTYKDYDKGTNTTFEHTSNIANGGSGYGSYASSQNNQYEGSTRYTETFYAKFVPVTPTKVTLAVAENGTYHYSTSGNSGDVIDSETTIESKERVSLTATSNSGYKFFGWYTKKGGQDIYFSYDSVSTSPALTQDTTIYAKFIPSNQATYIVRNKPEVQYYDFQAAANAAEDPLTDKVFLPLVSGVVPYKEGGYSISSGVTLLIPYESTNIVNTNTPDFVKDGSTAPLKFRELKLTAGVSIEVNGSICVNAKLRDRQNSNGAQNGASGMINMQEGSTIILNSGANLYCWGIIYGEGEITANSGATVYESFQVNDYPGGSIMAPKIEIFGQGNPNGQYQNFIDHKVFPIRIFCFPNIQSKLHLHYGATEKVATAFASLGLQKDIIFISKSAGLFTISSEGSSITKWYDINEDLQHFELRGDANLKSVQFTAGVSVFTADVNSANYILPIPHNMRIDVLPAKEGEKSTVNITENIAILPGANIYVDKGVTVNIEADNAVYVYDTAQWENNYTYAAIAQNAASNKNNFSIIYGRTAANKRSFLKKDLSDAVLEVAGTIEVNGALYTTSSGADIKGVDGGKVIFATQPPQTLPTVYQFIQSNITYPEIDITAAQLHNDTIKNPDYHYTQTSDAVAGDEFWYVESLGRWVKNEFGPELDIVDADNTKKTLTINANGWASSGWPYTVDGVKYEKGDREDDRTLIIPYNGTAGASLPIAVLDKDGKPICRHIYKVPFVYTGTEDMSDMNENSIVFVKSGTLTIGTDSVKEIYVADSAELEVTGKLTVGKLVLRTTPYKAAVLTIETGGSIALTDGGQVYYSRISPDAKQYYQFGLPLSCPLANVKMSNTDKLGGSQPKYSTAWMLKSYNEESRANNGISNEGANWTLLENTNNTGVITAGVGYEMFSNSKYYREFYFPVTLPAEPTTTVSVSYTPNGAAGAAHAGWNIITSPLTSKATVTIGDPATAIKVCWLDEDDGSYWQEQPTVIPPAIPFSYQASAGGYLNFVSTIAAAPRKQSAAEALTETEWVHLDIFDAYGEGDETSLFVHPTRFEQTYKTGIDMAKQSLTASRAILYTTHAYGDMAFAGVADSLLENGIDLVIYSPSAQELTFSLRENKFLNRLEYLWLADNKTGARTDLLMNDYICRADAGTIKGRFVLNGRFKAPQISTGIGNTQTDYNIYAIGNNIAISGVEQGTPIYVFDAVGHMIYTTAATSDEVIVPAPCAGVYMLSVGGQTAKLVINQ